ncbi:MAG TPA: pyridoxamine 5'-phosphate oxidase family protein [Candidatus Limnocylindrales bacterium]|nr:pyridoxamine 5'-phosphate oxidase family protein [Candidatus Limnocylindrales bacterium]
MPVRHVPYAEVREDALRLTASIVWSVVTTVDAEGRPRSRILHPVWTELDGELRGLVAARPTPVKLAEIAANPYVSCAYWTPAFDSVFIDAGAAWVTPDAKRAAWDHIRSLPPPVGYDPAPMWPDGPDSPGFVALTLTPYRIRVQLGAEVAKGIPDRFWSRSGAKAPPTDGMLPAPGRV